MNLWQASASMFCQVSFAYKKSAALMVGRPRRRTPQVGR